VAASARASATVVTSFTCGLLAITTARDRRAGRAGHRTDETRFDCHAVGGTTIAVRGVRVVTDLCVLLLSVTARHRVGACAAAWRARVPALDARTGGRAAI